MSSSTSNSSPHDLAAKTHPLPGGWRREWKVLLWVAFALLSVELALRVVGSRLSRNEYHIAEMPALATQVVEGASPRILLLGNSLVRLGIDEGVLREELLRGGGAAGTVTKMVPDMSTSLDWYAVYRKHFSAAKHPDVIIVSSFAHHYNDGEPVDARQLGWHFSRWSDVPELFRCDIPQAGDRVEFLLSRVSAIYGMRNEVLHILERIIPNYQQGAYRVNEAGRALAAKRAASRGAGGSAPAPTYDRLKRFMKLLREQNVKAVFVVMPPDGRWDPAFPGIVKAGGMTCIDAREVPGLTPAHFYDGYHLGPEGAAIFTRYLCTMLSQDDQSPLLR